MELRQLRYFVRIVETGSMGSAALDLNIGVSALSQQMSRLESELAIRLLQRTSRGVTPTSAGLAFYSRGAAGASSRRRRDPRRTRVPAFRARQRRHGSQYCFRSRNAVYQRHAGKLQ